MSYAHLTEHTYVFQMKHGPVFPMRAGPVGRPAYGNDSKSMSAGSRQAAGRPPSLPPRLGSARLPLFSVMIARAA